MKVIYNSQVLPIEEIPFSYKNRGFRYGDGLFETIVTGNAQVNLLPFHINRLFTACKFLKLTPPPINVASLAEMIQSLKAENSIEGKARVRLQVWRNEGGLYDPISSKSSFLMEANPNSSKFYDVLEKVDISSHAKVIYHQLSFAKTISAMPYIIASLEKTEKGLDDIFITDQMGYVAESSAANIFWVKDHLFYTPDLQTGCIAGVMRAHLMDLLPQHGFEVKEVLEFPKNLSKAEAIFTTNASGIRWVREFQGRTFQNPLDKLSFLC